MDAIKNKTLILTVTPGRSGTKLLARLLAESLKIDAEHEPAPRVNYVLRTVINAPSAAKLWLKYEKFPAILERSTGPVYAETSHLICKGFIEAILELDIRPRFVILTRPAAEVARSLFQLNAIPSRTDAGRLTLLGPDDPNVLPLPNWESYSDYQLCYWYAREIERRQVMYRDLFKERGIQYAEISMSALNSWKAFHDLSSFVAGEFGFTPSEEDFNKTSSINQNPRGAISNGRSDRILPADFEHQGQAIDHAVIRDLQLVARCPQRS